MYGDQDEGRLATESEAHAEWHRNSGVPMGTPGCPQDACHPDEPDWDIGPEDVWEDPRGEMYDRPHDEEPHDEYWDAPQVTPQELELSAAELIAEHTGIVEFLECQIAHDGCSERARWVATAHTGHSWRICHMLWIEQHATLGDPYVTVSYRRLP